ncbi:hypothetical protein V8C44DRAFT_177753 [Trichoderma aethiopicum]
MLHQTILSSLVMDDRCTFTESRVRLWVFCRFSGALPCFDRHAVVLESRNCDWLSVRLDEEPQRQRTGQSLVYYLPIETTRRFVSVWRRPVVRFLRSSTCSSLSIRISELLQAEQVRTGSQSIAIQPQRLNSGDRGSVLGIHMAPTECLDIAASTGHQFRLNATTQLPTCPQASQRPELFYHSAQRATIIQQHQHIGNPHGTSAKRLLTPKFHDCFLCSQRTARSMEWPVSFVATPLER